MNILFLSDNYFPETNAPAIRLSEHAKQWVKQGHSVTVVTCAPNFPRGRIYDGYRNAWRQEEYIDGVRVIRVKTYMAPNKGKIKRIVDFLSFMVSGFIVSLFLKKPDIVVGTSPQLFAVVAAWGVSRVHRLPFICEVRDLWPASIVAVGAMKKNLLIRLFEKIELHMYQSAAHVIVVTPAMKRNLLSRGVLEKKITVVSNGVDADSFSPRTRDLGYEALTGVRGKFVVGYFGTFGMAHALMTVVKAAELLRDQDEIVFLLGGAGAEEEILRTEVQKRELNNVIFNPPVKHELMPRYWSVCDLGLISLKNASVFSTVIPSKLFDIMGMGLPVIAAIPNGDAADIIACAEMGLVVVPEKEEALAEAILELWKDRQRLAFYAKNSRAAASSYSRKALAEQMLHVMETNGVGGRLEPTSRQNREGRLSI